MPPLVRVVGRDAHQPVHAALGLQVAVGVLAVDLERGVLDARPRRRAGGRARWSGSRGARPSAGTCASASAAQSCDSVPPAPGWIDTSAPSRSCSPDSRLRSSRSATSRLERAELGVELARAARRRPRPRPARAARPVAASDLVARAPVVDGALGALRAAPTVFCASSGRSQNPGAAMRGLERRRPRRRGDRRQRYLRRLVEGLARPDRAACLRSAAVSIRSSPGSRAARADSDTAARAAARQRLAACPGSPA